MFEEGKCACTFYCREPESLITPHWRADIRRQEIFVVARSTAKCAHIVVTNDVHEELLIFNVICSFFSRLVSNLPLKSYLVSMSRTWCLPARRMFASGEFASSEISWRNLKMPLNSTPSLHIAPTKCFTEFVSSRVTALLHLLLSKALLNLIIVLSARAPSRWVVWMYVPEQSSNGYSIFRILKTKSFAVHYTFVRR